MSAAGNKPRVAVLISGSGSNLQSLIDAAHAPNYPAEIALVLSNVATAYGIERANKAGIPVKNPLISGLLIFLAALAASLAEFKIEYVCLAGFMRILTADFVRLWAGRMLNIHPSLLPAFKGRNVHAQALAAGVTISGCTVHLVTPELDDGPIIVQAAVPVLPDDDEAHLAKRILAEEHRIYPKALAWLASGRINVADDDKTAQARARLGSLINPPV